MKFKISCPHCTNSLTLTDPKPGKYKPKCSKCSQPFAIVVEPSDPPKVRVGKIATTPPASSPAVTSSSPSTQAVRSAANLQPDQASNQPAKAANVSQAFDQTMPLADAANEQVIKQHSVISSKTLSAKPQEARPQFDATTADRNPALDATLPPEGISHVPMDATLAADLTADAVTTRAHDVTLPTDTTLVSGVASRASHRSTKTAGPSQLDVTISPSMADFSKPSNLDVTMDSQMPERTKAQAMDATMDATMAAPAIPSKAASAKSSQSHEGDFSVNESVSGQVGTSDKTNVQVERLGGYRIVKELGEGGMGKVYLARQISLDRPCAVKTIQASWARNPKAIARFIREAYAAAQLTHHNVVQIYDLGQEQGTSFFSMELVGGGSLDDQLRSKGKLPPKLAATLILQAARGLRFAHDHGMVHRDIKPANLMLTSDGLVKIADMGLVKTPHSDETSEEDQADVQSMMLASARSQVTLAGASMGTPAYMSPEQAEDAASVDKRADIYSLGCTFYALLTGKPPFDGKTLLEVITKHRQEKITRPEVVISDLPSKLGDIIERMTEKLPEDRYQDLTEVIEDLEVFLELRADMSDAKISYFDARDRPESDTTAAPSKAESSTGTDSEPKKPVVVQADIPPEMAGRLQVAARNFQMSPLLLARKFAPPAWYAVCGLLAIAAVLLALMSGFSLIAQGAKTLASSATEAVSSIASSTPAADTTADASPSAVTTPPTASATQSVSLGDHFSSLISRAKWALGYALALLIGPVATVFLGGWEGKSPLALRYRESFLVGGILNKIYWGFTLLVILLVIYFLGLWIPVICALIFGALAGAGYYFGIEKPLAAKRIEPLEQVQGLLKQLRLRGLEEDQVQLAVAKHSGKDWEELYENLFGYDALRSMRKKLAQNVKSPRKTFRAYRDRFIDRWDERLAEAKRASEERLLANTEKAELVAGGMSAAAAQKQAEAVAASMVDAATETKKTMQELASGRLTDQAAEAKRERIKKMLAEARSGKFSKQDRRSRAMEALLGQLLGSKLRFAVAAVLLLATGMWINANRQPLESYWNQAKTSVSNISLDGGLEGATASAKETLAVSSQHQWIPILGGLVDQRNILYVALAAALMCVGTLCYGWKVSFFFIPATIVLLAIPMFLG